MSEPLLALPGPRRAPRRALQNPASRAHRYRAGRRGRCAGPGVPAKSAPHGSGSANPLQGRPAQVMLSELRRNESRLRASHPSRAEELGVCRRPLARPGSHTPGPGRPGGWERARRNGMWSRRMCGRRIFEASAASPVRSRSLRVEELSAQGRPTAICAPRPKALVERTIRPETTSSFASAGRRLSRSAQPLPPPPNRTTHTRPPPPPSPCSHSDPKAAKPRLDLPRPAAPPAAPAARSAPRAS